MCQRSSTFSPSFTHFPGSPCPVAGPPRPLAAASYCAACLQRAGGLPRIRGELIDDVALGRVMKRSGARTWLGFINEPPEVRNVRPYPHLADLWSMVARIAYTHLRTSPVLLAATIAGLGLLYAVPPVAGLARRSSLPAVAGLGA